jgi:hypothetical protein
MSEELFMGLKIPKILVPVFLLVVFAAAQQTTTGIDQPTHNMDGMSGMPDAQAGASHAMHAMESHHMDAGPHMKMTMLRAPQPADQQRATEIVAQARQSVQKYQDYRAALADGYRIFLPNLKQPMYHFTNYRYAFEAAFHFNPEHPTSLLYEKQDDGYKLIGVMYTAPKNTSEGELNQRIPLSVAQWHAHVNMCMPPRSRRQEMLQPHPQFGLKGSISTKEECKAAGGTFIPQIFGWMVHMYPFESSQEAIWSVERQLHHGE